MKNNSNIYDIDGNLLRSIDDTHKWTVEEAKAKMEQYRKKLEEFDENDPKAAVYSTYMRNLSQYLMSLYAKMSTAELTEQLNNNTTQEQVNKAIEELKSSLEDDDTATNNSIENEVQGPTPGDQGSITDEEPRDAEIVERTDSNIHEEVPTTQGDLLVERDNVNNTMDEYVEFEEV